MAVEELSLNWKIQRLPPPSPSQKKKNTCSDHYNNAATSFVKQDARKSYVLIVFVHSVSLCSSECFTQHTYTHRHYFSSREWLVYKPSSPFKSGCLDSTSRGRHCSKFFRFARRILISTQRGCFLDLHTGLLGLRIQSEPHRIPVNSAALKRVLTKQLGNQLL